MMQQLCISISCSVFTFVCVQYVCVFVVCGYGWVSRCVGVYVVCLWCVCVCVFYRVPMVPEVPLQPAGGGPTVVGTEFINVSNDDIEEVWRDHVATLLKGKSEAVAVNTMFLLNRLFLVSDPHAVLLSSADVW